MQSVATRMPKRRLSLRDVVAHVDEVLSMEPLKCCPRLESPSKELVEPTLPSSQTSSTATNDDASNTSSESALGRSAIDLFLRQNDDVGETALFLAQSLASLSTRPSLMELLVYVRKHNVEGVMMSLKRLGSQGAFLEALCSAGRLSGQEELALLLFIHACICHVEDAELASTETIVAFLARSMGTSSTPTAAVDAKGVAPTRGGSHWSKKFTKRSPSNQEEETSTTDAAELVAAAEAVSGGPLHRSSFQATLHILSSLVLLDNRRSTKESNALLIHRLARAGGLTAVLSALKRVDDRETAFAFVELLTASHLWTPVDSEVSGCLVESLGSRLAEVSVCVCDEDDAGAILTVETALRVATNLSNLVPHLFSREASAVGNSLRRLLMWCRTNHAAGALTENTIFMLCTAVNVVKYEGRHAGSAFTTSFLGSESARLLLRLAEWMFESYESGETENVVRSGYLALLLGVISLITTPDGSTLRVPVIQALHAATNDGLRDRVGHQSPMVLVVAILQEFLLFQSSTGTLTKDTVVELSSILDALIAANNIEVDPHTNSS